MPQIFISYARRDERSAAALAEQLEQLEVAGVGKVWFDRSLELGGAWRDRIREEIGRSDLFLLLVSPAYLASEFVRGEELPLIREAGESGGQVIPVVIAPCTWTRHPYIGSLQAFARGHVLAAPTTIKFGRQAAELVEQVWQIAVALSPDPEHHPLLPNTAVPDPPEELASSTVPASRARLDGAGRANKGSQLQTQIYVNARTSELDAAVRAALPLLPGDAVIEWRSPLASMHFAEYRDAGFLAAVERAELTGELSEFWPGGGPRWDALAIVRSDRGPAGVLLVEGKSYPAEMAGGGSKAQGRSRERIEHALAETQKALGIAAGPERWLGRHYQFANRLAHLLWLRRHRVEAWLLQLLYTGDPHRPTTDAEWQTRMGALYAEMGIEAHHLQHVGMALLPALDRALLEHEAQPGS